MPQITELPVGKVLFPDAKAVTALEAFFASAAQGVLASTAIQPADLDAALAAITPTQVLTQAEYDALETKDPAMIYFVTS